LIHDAWTHVYICIKKKDKFFFV